MNTTFNQLLETIDTTNIHVIDSTIQKSAYCGLDLSIDQTALHSIDLSKSTELENFILQKIKENGAEVAFGGYLEKRNIYRRSDYFNQESKPIDERNIHLGIDIWAPADTSVHAALSGKIHSFANNTNFGDYGPTILLEHQFDDLIFYTLYGHLSLASIQQLEIGESVKQGQKIGSLGTAEVNGDYPPHLHFQIILDLQGNSGDYPGVCSENDLLYYRDNCPNPELILNLE